MSLENLLLKTKPREESGSKTSRKFKFQNDFSLFLLLRRHNSLDDYTFLFDFHEDLVVLNSSKNADKIHFYQIKSKDSGKWSLNDLIKSPKGAQSIISKLYNNKILFPHNTEKITFVSNAEYNFKSLIDTDKPEFSVSDISAKNLSDIDKKNCLEKIKKELSLSKIEDFEELFHFKVTKLNNKDSTTHTIGELSSFLDKANPDHKINPNLAYKQLSSEILRKTKSTISENSVGSYLDLIELKGITKGEFDSFLIKAGLYKSYEVEWQDIANELDKSGINFFEKSLLKNAYRQVCGRLINDKTNIYFNKIIDDIREKISNNIISLSKQHLYEFMFSIKAQISYNDSYDEKFIEALILKKIYEEINK